MKLKIAMIAAALATGLAFSAPGSAEAACFVKASEGTNTTEQGAKFQAFEALLQATDWGLWAAWMANGSTPGYKLGKANYKCAKGTGLGVTCRANVKICKV